MSSVFVQVGQCGNQIGKEFYNIVSKLQDQRPVFASEDGKWRSVNIDSEAKVLNMLYSINRKCLREANIVTGKHGRGANWAMGYHGLGKDNALPQALEALRREVERCDSYCGTIMIHSLSGGTGSGLGSHLCESIKEEYPLAHILSAAIAPHASGESPLQHYNFLLSLAWLYRFSDAVVLFQNDEILHRTMGVNVSKMARNSQEISLTDMNIYIADCLAGMFLPLGNDTSKMENRSFVYLRSWMTQKSLFSHNGTKSAWDQVSHTVAISASEKVKQQNQKLIPTTYHKAASHAFVGLNPLKRQSHNIEWKLEKQFRSGISEGSEPWEMLRSVCPMPDYKVVHSSCCCKSKSSWEAITGSLVNKLNRYDKDGNPFVSLANLAVVRGESSHTVSRSFSAVENKLKMGYNCVRWNPFPVDFWIGAENLIGSMDESSLTVCANTSTFTEFAQNELTKAKTMYNSRAYLHWYQRWGCDENCFTEAFETLESVIHAYTSAATR